jgi:GNAT superfamily N-acetyltransferase
MASHPAAATLNQVGEVDGKIIASQCYWLQRVHVQGRELLAKQGVDFCVHPDFQRLGVRKRLWQFAADTPHRNFQVLFGAASTHPAMRRVEAAFQPAPSSKLANAVQTFVRRQSSTPAPSPAARDSVTVREARRFDDGFDAFWDAASESFDFACVRDSAALNWRYADARAGRFTIHVAEDGARGAGPICGFAASCVPKPGRGYIADLLALPGRDDVAAALLERAVAALSDAGVSKIEAWLPGRHPYRALLDANGFRPRGAVAFGVRPAIEYLSTLPMPFRDDPAAAIHISAGDCDLV